MNSGKYSFCEQTWAMSLSLHHKGQCEIVPVRAGFVNDHYARIGNMCAKLPRYFCPLFMTAPGFIRSSTDGSAGNSEILNTPKLLCTVHHGLLLTQIYLLLCVILLGTTRQLSTFSSNSCINSLPLPSINQSIHGNSTGTKLHS